MEMCDIECEYCWCKVFYPKTNIVTAYCAIARQLIQNVAKHSCNADKRINHDQDQGM